MNERIDEILKTRRGDDIDLCYYIFEMLVHEKRPGSGLRYFMEKIRIEDKMLWCCYFLALVNDEESIACHVYKILNEILRNMQDKSALLDELEEKRTFIDIHYPDTLIQIWHYYVMAENMDATAKEQLFSAYTQNIDFVNANPIIICCFINSGNNTNREVWNYICQGYKDQTNEPDWKGKVMFSKWWLPIFKIKMLDNHNYEGFFQESVFPDVLGDLAKELENN